MVSGALALVAAASVQAQVSAWYRVACGGLGFLDPNGHFWQADGNYVGGSVYQTDSSIANTGMPQLYKSERWFDTSTDPLKYTFKVLPGQYQVNLHFAEIYDSAFAVGKRVFDVNVNGVAAATDLDIFAQVGADAPYILNPQTTAGADSLITVDFTNKVLNAKISGIEVLPLNPPRATAAPYYIHCGGDDYIDAQGNYWEADSHYTGGSTYVSANPVTNTDAPFLYTSERYNDPNKDSLSYSFDVAEGNYTVRLHFAEIYFQNAGQRVFSYDINGTTEATDYDIVADVGPNVAVVKEYTVPSVGGKIVINFHNEVENAKVSAIEVVPAVATKNRLAAAAAGLQGPSARASAPGTLSLRWPAVKDFHAEVSDFRGRGIASMSAHGTATVAGLRAGLYMVRLQSGATSIAFRVPVL